MRISRERSKDSSIQKGTYELVQDSLSLAQQSVTSSIVDPHPQFELASCMEHTG